MNEVERHLARLMDRLAVDLVLDVGANEGQWAQGLRGAGFRGRIVSFEPVGSSFERLRAASAGDRAWEVQRIALGREDGSLVLQRTSNSVFASALPPSRYARVRFPEGVAVDGVERVPLRRLDGIVRDLAPGFAAPRIFLKLDTQGFDLEVFEGARGVLEQVVGLQAELSVLPLYDGAPRWVDALAAYAACGFSPTGFFPVVRAEPYLVLCEFDCVMARYARLAAPPRSPDAPPVSVIVTAVVDSPALRRCLEATAEQTRAASGELLLVVNAEPDTLGADARAALETLCDRVVFEPRVGKSHALNTAVRAARGGVIAFTDDDALPEPGWLEALVRPLLALDRDPALVGCGGPVQPDFPPDTPDWLLRIVSRDATHFLGPRHELAREPLDYTFEGKGGSASAPLGANCAYRREVFGSYFFDPRLGPNRVSGLRGGEDYLLGRLLLRDGYRLRYCPDARVRHPVEPSRTTEAYVLRGYYLQGVEWVRIQRALAGELEPARALRARQRRLRLKLLRERWSGGRDPARRIHLLAKYEHRRGQLDEMERRVETTAGRDPGA